MENETTPQALVTNIDFDAWGEYLGDPPIATAFLDRIVDGYRNRPTKAITSKPNSWCGRAKRPSASGR